MLLIAYYCLLALLASPATPSPPAIDAFIEEMAAKHGFDKSELEVAFGRVRSQKTIIELMDRAVEPKPWDEYRNLFVNPEKLEGGERFWRDHHRALERARERYGVPEEIITAVIGIESHYGRHLGRFNVLEALVTLAFDYPRRSGTFRLELEHYLLLAREEGIIGLESTRGSYAGAMGIAQFMPGSYRRYAIDFDGDGRRDLLRSAEDAIGSVANYFTAHGWQSDQPIAAPVQIVGGSTEPFQSSRLSTRYRLEELKALGVEAPGVYALDSRVIPVKLSNRVDTEYWLGFDNFYVITRYNQSTYYAMAVHQLAAALRERVEANTASAP
ncbi:MAG TPA: lytic murein transglycosylase B [Vicinamibacteria bacterium]|nr:lytic murein transglycosylase B [Vicinamibacteria bacterium]